MLAHFAAANLVFLQFRDSCTLQFLQLRSPFARVANELVPLDAW